MYTTTLELSGFSGRIIISVHKATLAAMGNSKSAGEENGTCPVITLRSAIQRQQYARHQSAQHVRTATSYAAC